MTHFDAFADHNDAQARKQARQAAKEATESFNKMIEPKDIQDDACTWSDVDTDALKAEAHKSATIMLSENQQPYNALSNDLTIILRRNDLMRIPLEDINFTREKAVSEGYWPYKMSRQEVTELLEETDIHPDYHTEARQTIKAGIIDKLTEVKA